MESDSPTPPTSSFFCTATSTQSVSNPQSSAHSMSSSFFWMRQRLATGRRGFHAGVVTALPEIPFKLADIGEGIAEVEVLQWFVKRGDEVKQFQNVCEVQSDKATVEITSRYDGVVAKVHYEVGDMAKVGSTLVDIDVDDATAAKQAGGKKKVMSGAPVPRTAPSPVVDATASATTAATSEATVEMAVVPVLSRRSVVPRGGQKDEKLLTSPSVRRLAMEHSIDLHDVDGTGPEGRILKGDLLDYIRLQATQSQGAETLAYEPEAAVPPHLEDGVQMDALHELRKELNPLAELRGVKLSFMPFVIKAASLALKQYPILNSSVNESETELTLIASHNISVAMDTPTGLIVPNVKNVQVAIGAVGRIQQLPRYDEEGKVRPVRVMIVSWSGDHRVIDGATMARFSNEWKGYLETPTVDALVATTDNEGLLRHHPVLSR
uniref:Dihydrolipoamide acetyltransferase component of pyruvate dehydrogenase complex n=1 Tax=Hyaloperonospora arabidopsidis (strain Emoy2) TaxID=559515 RepID=M4B474_HYAAE